MGAASERFSERLGQNPASEKKQVIWFHAASLGEVKQIGPLAEKMARTEQAEILVTTTTASGADWVAREMPYAIHRFAPIDTPRAVRGFLDGWSIRAAIFVEADLWPRLVMELQKRDVPQILLNARHSRSRMRFHRVFSTLLSPFALVTCRSETIADEMRSLGISADRVRVLPDLRLSLAQMPVDHDQVAQLSEIIGDRPRWLAASTHPADEEAVIAAHQDVTAQTPDALLIVAPRHPQRGDALKKLARDQGFNVAQRSLGEEISASTKVYVADTLGELGAFFSLSPLVFLGGSFGSEGGHTPYEPASFGTAILHGPNIRNFTDAYAGLTKAGGALEVPSEGELGPAVIALMQGERAGSMANAGLAFMDNAQESLAAYSDLIGDVLSQKQVDQQ